MATLVLAHANGYPPGSYRALLAELGEPLGHAVQALEHRPLWDASPAPTFLGWEHYANDLIDFIKRQCDQPVWLLGHSMGAACGVIGKDASSSRTRWSGPAYAGTSEPGARRTRTTVILSSVDFAANPSLWITRCIRSIRTPSGRRISR